MRQDRDDLFCHVRKTSLDKGAILGSSRQCETKESMKYEKKEHEPWMYSITCPQLSIAADISMVKAGLINTGGTGYKQAIARRN